LDDPVVRKLLEEPNLARLAYIGVDGRPRVVPIWFSYIDGDIVMVTGPRAEKARALAANPAVALTIDSATTMRAFRQELRWNQAFHFLNRGM